jgi:arachidonate 15-lipoxygenase
MPKPSFLPDHRDLALSLPQDDRDALGRDRTLEAARDEYRYTYDKPNIRGLAMCQELPREANPSLGWTQQVIEASLALVRNSKKEAEEEGGDDAMPGPIAITNLVSKGGLKAVLSDVAEIVIKGTGRGPVSRLDDFARLFQEWRAPAEAFELFFDSTFARMRVAGPNPAWIRRVDPSAGLPDDFGVTREHYQAAVGQAAVGSGDSLEAARAEGRLFLAEYRQLQELHRGCVPVPKAIELDYAKNPAAWDAAHAERELAYARGAHPKLLVAPLALFAVPKGGRELVPVAIQLYPNGHRGRTHPVYTPRDGMDWLAAKAAVHAADGTVHETFAHLGRTHLVQEAFGLAIRNCLSSRHPLHRLLTPHFEGTAFINDLADSSLVNPGGHVDQLLLPTIGDCIQLTGQAVTGLDFNDAMLARDLELRGVSDREVLPSYPYRDDGLLVWGAIERWVRGFIEHYYGGDADVVADLELQAFVRQVGQRDARDAAGRTVGGGIKNVGEGGPRVETRAYLVRMVTQIIWNGSAQHAAVNFPQGHAMIYPAHYPLALMGESFGDAPKNEADYLALLPWHESAQVQVFILQLLSSVYHTRLGHYARSALPGGWFGSPVVHDLERALHEDLERVETEIDRRNASRVAYRFLRPSEIPQSINI